MRSTENSAITPLFGCPRSRISNKWRCSVCGNEDLQFGLSAGPLPRPLNSHLASQPFFAHQRIWTTEVKGEVFDLVQCSQRIYTGDAANISQASQALFDRPKKWAQWILSMNSLWQEDSPMPDRPLTVHCSGLGGGLLSPEHEYDIFFRIMRK